MLYWMFYILIFIAIIVLICGLATMRRRSIPLVIAGGNSPLVQCIRIPLEDRVDFVVEDRHNVHNTTLQRDALSAITRLKQSDQHRYTTEETFKMIDYLIEFYPDPDLDKLDSASYVLHMIRKLGVTYDQLPEVELVRLLWERINHADNRLFRDQLIDNLITQLADCRCGKRCVHCTEGRIMRLLQTLECSDATNMVHLCPMWAYKEEIAHKVTMYRQKLLDKAPSEYRELESKTDLDLDVEDRRLLRQFNRCLIKNLKCRFERDYVSKGVMTKEELDEITKTYYENL